MKIGVMYTRSLLLTLASPGAARCTNRTRSGKVCDELNISQAKSFCKIAIVRRYERCAKLKGGRMIERIERSSMAAFFP
jgi:hypothetical protein